MCNPKTPEDHRVIIDRILRHQGLSNDVVDQVIVNVDGVMRLTRDETITRIINKLSSVITVEQESEVAHALNS